MGERVSVEKVVAAAPEAVWPLIADVTRMGEWSPENVACEWIGGASAPAVGAKFRGTNQNGKKKWKTVATIVDAEPGKSFAFVVKAGPFGVARWEYRFEAADAGSCRITETWIDQRSVIGRTLGGPVSGVSDRASHNRAGMETTLERVAAAVAKPTA